MKIAFVSSMKGSAWGGSEELWAAAAERALEAGHAVLVCVFDWPSRPAKVAKLRDRGAELLLRPLKAGRLSRLLGTPRWLKNLQAWKPDAVVLSQGGAYECAGRRSTRAFIPWLIGSRVPFVNIIQFNSETADCGSDAAQAARDLYMHAAHNCFVAARNITQAERKLGIAIPRARVVRNPVNLADTSMLLWPQGTRGEELAPTFATVARLQAATKGQDRLFEVLSRGAWRERPWSLSLFGEGPDEQAYREQVERLGLTGRVKFAGQTGDIRGVWNTHHALVLPSLAEGTPLAMVEAMLVGRLPIVTDVGGCADWIRDGENGFLATSPSVEDLAAAMERAWVRRAEWARMALAARETAARLHDGDPGGSVLALVVQHTTD